jgi:hypothetical protein
MGRATSCSPHDPDSGETAARAFRWGDVARRFTLLGIVEKPLRMVRQRDSQQCHTRRATPVIHSWLRNVLAVCYNECRR